MQLEDPWAATDEATDERVGPFDTSDGSGLLGAREPEDETQETLLLVSLKYQLTLQLQQLLASTQDPDVRERIHQAINGLAMATSPQSLATAVQSASNVMAEVSSRTIDGTGTAARLGLANQLDIARSYDFRNISIEQATDYYDRMFQGRYESEHIELAVYNLQTDSPTAMSMNTRELVPIVETRTYAIQNNDDIRHQVEYVRSNEALAEIARDDLQESSNELGQVANHANLAAHPRLMQQMQEWARRNQDRRPSELETTVPFTQRQTTLVHEIRVALDSNDIGRLNQLSTDMDQMLAEDNTRWRAAQDQVFARHMLPEHQQALRQRFGFTGNQLPNEARGFIAGVDVDDYRQAQARLDSRTSQDPQADRLTVAAYVMRFETFTTVSMSALAERMIELSRGQVQNIGESRANVALLTSDAPISEKVDLLMGLGQELFPDIVQNMNAEEQRNFYTFFLTQIEASPGGMQGYLQRIATAQQAIHDADTPAARQAAQRAFEGVINGVILPAGTEWSDFNTTTKARYIAGASSTPTADKATLMSLLGDAFGTDSLEQAFNRSTDAFRGMIFGRNISDISAATNPQLRQQLEIMDAAGGNPDNRFSRDEVRDTLRAAGLGSIAAIEGTAGFTDIMDGGTIDNEELGQLLALANQRLGRTNGGPERA